MDKNEPIARPPSTFSLPAQREKPLDGKTPQHRKFQQALQEANFQTLETQTEESWSQEESNGSSQGSFLTKLSMIAAALLPISIIFYTVNSLAPDQTPAPTPAAEQTHIPVNPYLERSSAEEIEAASLETITGFLHASSHEERCQYVVGGLALLDKMKRFYEHTPPDEPWTPVQFLNSNALAIEGVPIYASRAIDESGKKEKAFSLVASDSRMLIEWEGTVGYSEMSWQNFLAEKPDEPVEMRVFLSLPKHPADQEIAGRFLIHDQLQDEYVPVQTNPGSDAFRALVPFLVQPGLHYPVVVDLKWNSEEDIAEITEFQQAYWFDFKRYRKLYQQ